jgi:hypothetical protein
VKFATGTIINSEKAGWNPAFLKIIQNGVTRIVESRPTERPKPTTIGIKPCALV